MEPFSLFVYITLPVVSLYFLRKFFVGSRCYSKVTLSGKTIIITGANTGIGKETAKDLAGRGARVILACRNMEKGQRALKEIQQATGSEEVVLLKLDLASLTSVRNFAKEFLSREKSLDILINNAGVMFCPQWETEDGFDIQFGTNHLGHFLLTLLLLDLLKQSAAARIVNVSSLAHHGCFHLNMNDLNFKSRTFSSSLAYCQSKLANILFTKELAKQLKGTTVTAYALHPGAVRTDLMRNAPITWAVMKQLLYIATPFLNFFCKTPEQGAQTSIYCAVTPSTEMVSGQCYSDCSLMRTSSLSRDEDLARQLWEVSCEMVNLTACVQDSG